MMARIMMRWSTIFVALSLALTIGCGDEVSTEQDDDPGPDQPYDPPEQIDEHSTLYHHNDVCQGQTELCPLTPTVGDDLPLQIQLVDADSNPIENALIDFEADSVPSEDVQLSAGSAVTNEEGVAETRLQAGDEDDPIASSGDVEVTAEVADDDEVNTLEFLIGINTKNAASYIIQFEHLGESSPDHVRPLLLDPDKTCDEAIDDFFEDGFWSADTALPEANVLPGNEINDAQKSNVENGDAYTVIGVAEQQRGTEYVEVAYGCNDEAEPVEQGMNVYVDVELNDHLPHLDEAYNVTHEFDLSSALPEPVQEIIDLLGNLADNPGEFIIGGQDSTGLLDDILYGVLEDMGLDDVTDIIDTLLESETLVSAVQDFLNDQIEEVLPDWANDVFSGVSDITDMLQAFTVHGRMLLDEQPEPALGDDGQPVGLLFEDDTQQRWDSLEFQWSAGCDEDDVPDPEECAQVLVSASDLGSEQAEIIEGSFDATVYGTDSIEIERHSMSLHYGALLIGLIEKVILPRLLGDDVTSLNDLFAYFVDCHDMAELIDDDSESNLYNLAYDMCQDLQTQATDALYDYVEETLVADGDEHFRIATPSDSPCRIQQPEDYPSSWPGEPLPFIETFGLQEPDEGDVGMGCDWDVEINYSDGSEADFNVDGNFEAQFAD